jgi:hypothetical protein
VLRLLDATDATDPGLDEYTCDLGAADLTEFDLDVAASVGAIA